MKKIIGLGLFLLSLLILICMGLTAEAGINMDSVNKEIELSAGTYTLDDIWADANVGNDNLTNYTTGVWLLNWSIVVETDATLLLNPTDGTVGCSWLKMNTTNSSGKSESHIDVQGDLFVNDTTITGWNYTGDCNMTWNTSFRPYIYLVPLDAGDTPWASFLNSTIGYLGYDIDNKYGIVYEDNTVMSTDLDSQGWMHNCTVMENYIGIDFQGCENMNVTNTWMNDTHEAGIVYTLGGITAHGSHGGFIGDHPTWTHRPGYTSTAVDYCNGSGIVTDSMGIRLFNSHNLTMDQVNIQDAYTDGLMIQNCNNLTISNTTSYLNTNAANDYNIYLSNVTNSSFLTCNAYSPDGAASGGNWMFTSISNNNDLTDCWGFGSIDLEDFYLDTATHNNTFTTCKANNSVVGFMCVGDTYNSFINCYSHNHTLYDYKFWGSDYNSITGGSANDSTIGVLIYDDADNNTVTELVVNRQTSYGIQIGDTDGISDDNIIEGVTMVGTTTGDGIYIFGNCTDNYVGNTSVTGCAHVAADGMGIADYAYLNQFNRCYSNSSGDAGFSISEYASNNTISNCIAYGNKDGLELYGSGSRDNTISNSTFNGNSWGVYMWPGASSNCIDNYFWYCNIHNNTQTGVDIGRVPLTYFYECNILDNTGYGFEIKTDSVVLISNCSVYNSAASRVYDFYIDNSSSVDVFNKYIFGYDKNINFQYAVTQPYGLIAHDDGDGIWTLNTTLMTVRCNAGKDVWVNLTDWTGATYRKWYVTGVDGDYVYQKIGGLTAGVLYDLKVSGTVVGTYNAQSEAMLGSTTGIVWFNNTGPWSTRYFEVTPHTSDDGGGGGGGGGASTDDEETTTPTRSMDNTILMVIIFIAILGVVGYMLWWYYYKENKK